MSCMPKCAAPRIKRREETGAQNNATVTECGMMQAEEFLWRLDRDATKFLFVTFADKPNSDVNLTRTFYGTFTACEQALKNLNSLGAGIFVTVNVTKGNRRRKEDVVQARAIWQEDDSGTDKAPTIAPHMTVESSPGHYHRYWLTTQEDMPTWEKAQIWMCRKYDSDPGARDISRVLRMPGFYNHKRDTPHLVQLVSVNSAPRYTWKAICEGIGLPEDQEPQVEAAQDSTLAKYLAQIKSGEHLHTPLRAIMMINANKGHDIEYNRVVCQGLISSCPDEDRRRKASADLEAMLRATYRKIEEEQVEDIDPDSITFSQGVKLDLQWPPGLLGELAQAANEFFVIPNRTAATVTALSLVAGIVGRRYNINSGGLNLYSTVMMPTGAGKDSIRKFCQRVLMDKALLGTNGLSFLGPQNFTGPKALLSELQSRPSMLCVMTEAGLLYKTDSGDKQGLTRVILQAYTSSGQYEIIEQERYSSQQDSIGIIHAPALTILNEATPVTLLNELKHRESINTGELPRMWIFMLNGATPYPNPVPHQLNMPNQLADHLKVLLNNCYSIQNNAIPEVINVPVPSGYRDFAHECIDIKNRLMEETPNHAIMYTRAAHKVLKTAAVLATLDNPTHPQISALHWTWARHFFDYEMHNIEPIIGNTSDIAAALEKGAVVIAKLLRGEYTGKNKHIKPELRNRGIFTESPFKQAVAGLPAIRDLGTSARYGSPKSGARVLLEYMLAEGYLRKAQTYARSNSRAYQVTPQFKDYCSMILGSE